MMKPVNCSQEAAVAKAIRAGSMETSLTTHAAQCAVCSQIVQVSSWMQEAARNSEGHPILPDASLVWWRARLSEKKTNAEKAQDVFEWVEIASAVAISLGLGGWVAWNWSAIQNLMAWILAGAQLPITSYSVTILFSPVVILLTVAALVLTYPILADE